MNELVDLCIREAVDRLQAAEDRLRRELKDHRECVGMMISILRQLPRSEVVEFAIAEAERQFECPDGNAWRLHQLYTRLTHPGVDRATRMEGFS